jgi:hypothetical protein
MRTCFFRNGRVRVQVVLDRVLPDEHCSCRGDEDGDRVGASAYAQQSAVVALHRHLAGDVVDPELGQPLPHAAGGGAPLGLPKLIHQGSPLWACVTSPGILLYN